MSLTQNMRIANNRITEGQINDIWLYVYFRIYDVAIILWVLTCFIHYSYYCIRRCPDIYVKKLILLEKPINWPRQLGVLYGDSEWGIDYDVFVQFNLQK